MRFGNVVKPARRFGLPSGPEGDRHDYSINPSVDILLTAKTVGFPVVRAGIRLCGLRRFRFPGGSSPL